MYFESGKMDKNAMFQESFKNGFGYMSVNFQNMDNRATGKEFLGALQFF